jgi:plastocyanin
VRRYLPLLTATVLLAAGVAGVNASASPSDDTVSGRGGALVSGGGVSATPQQQARAKAIRNCRRLRSGTRRKVCLRRVQRRFAAAVLPQQGPVAARIDVRDKYFSPALVSIRTGQSVLWVWSPLNSEAHNVDLIAHPVGVRRLDFSTPSSPSVGFEFRRTFRVPGTYDFVCSIHHNMTMKVEVSR